MYTDDTNQFTAPNSGGEHAIQAVPLFSAEHLLRLWELRRDSSGRFVSRETEGLLAVRTQDASLTLVAAFYSPLHRRTIQQGLKRFTRRREITDAAIAEARVKAEAIYRECCEPSLISPKSAQRLRA